MKGGNRGARQQQFLSYISTCQSTPIAQNIVTTNGKWSKRKAVSRPTKADQSIEPICF
jgi:hypothetical protein